MKAELLYWSYEHHAQLVFKGSYVKDPLRACLKTAGWVPEPFPRERLKNPRPSDWTDVFLPQDELGLPRPDDAEKIHAALDRVKSEFKSIHISGPRRISFREFQTYGKEKDSETDTGMIQEDIPVDVQNEDDHPIPVKKLRKKRKLK